MRHVLVFHGGHIDPGENLVETSVEPASLDLDHYTFTAPFRCIIKLRRTAQRIDVEFNLATRVELNCASCGDKTPVVLEASSFITYLPRSQMAEETDEDTDLEFYDEEIDLRQPVRDAFLVALPIAPMCRAGCKGLCPVCGANLNREKCNCQPQTKPSPFEDLRRMIDG